MGLQAERLEAMAWDLEAQLLRSLINAWATELRVIIHIQYFGASRG